MAVYKIFPTQDSTIYSGFPNLNTGLDEILEVSAQPNIAGDNTVSRALIQFNQRQISNVLGMISGSYNTYLRLFLANASTLPSIYSVEVYPITKPWEMGLGRFSNNPQTTAGVTWLNASSTVTWSHAGGDTGSLISTQSFDYQSVKDLSLDVTTATTASFGYLVKFPNAIEFNSGSNTNIKYFSVDTHTIYPPCLEFRWDDSVYSSSLPLISSSQAVVSLNSNAQTFSQGSVQEFRVTARERYPVRHFQTSSIYLNAQVLPSSSYFSIKDLDTDEIVVDFDINATKLSADNQGNYFTVYMSGLEPERYYKVLVKTVLSDGETIIFDNNNYFKVGK